MEMERANGYEKEGKKKGSGMEGTTGMEVMKKGRKGI